MASMELLFQPRLLPPETQRSNPGRTCDGAERLFSPAETGGGGRGGSLPAENNGVKCDEALLPEQSHQEENPGTITVALAISGAKLAPNFGLPAGC